jgi:putative transposase
MMATCGRGYGRSRRSVAASATGGWGSLISGRLIRILAVVDDFTRECLTLVVDTSLSSARIARELDTVIAVRGVPLMIVSGNGTELTSLAILRWT